MDFFEVIQKRQSVRDYRSDPVDEKSLNLILESTRRAPTAHNNQPFTVIVIHTEGREEELKKIYAREWFTQAPILLCVCAHLDEGWVSEYNKHSFVEFDTAIVMTHIILTAAACGLGTCPVGSFNVDEARKFLGLPPEIKPMLFTPLGVPASFSPPRERKPLSELVRYEKW